MDNFLCIRRGFSSAEIFQAISPKFDYLKMKALISTVIVALSLANTVAAQLLTKNQQDFILDNAIAIEVDENFQNGNWLAVVE